MQWRRPSVVGLLAGAFVAMTLLLVAVGVTVAPVAVAAAVPFAVAAALLWYHASGRFTARVRESVERERRQRQRRERQRPPGGRRRQRARATGGARGRGRRGTDRERGPEERDRPGRQEALQVLGLDPGASQREIKRAYRRRVKETHPDRGGDERTFKRVTAAYERLRE